MILNIKLTLDEVKIKKGSLSLLPINSVKLKHK